MNTIRQIEIIHREDLSAELHSRVTRQLVPAPREWSPPWEYWDAHRRQCEALLKRYQELHEAYRRCRSDDERERIVEQAIELLRELPWERVVRSPLV